MVHSAVPRTPPSVTCAEAQKLLERFLGGGLRTREIVRLRAHRRTCGACEADYAAGIELTARIGRDHREERLEIARQVRHLRMEADILDVVHPARNSRSRLARLRTLLYPVFFALVMGHFATRGLTPASRAFAESGPVTIDGHALFSEDGAAPMRPGRSVATGPDGRARIEARDASAALDPASRVVVDSTRPLRLLLSEGTLDIEGEVDVVTPSGVLHAAGGRATIERRDGLVHVLGGAGTPRWVELEGTHVIEAGAHFKR